MEPVKLEDISDPRAKNLQSPAGMDNCDPLAVVPLEDRFVSFWRPTPEELDRLNQGGSIQLHIFGNRHPPVLLVAN